MYIHTLYLLTEDIWSTIELQIQHIHVYFSHYDVQAYHNFTCTFTDSDTLWLCMYVQCVLFICSTEKYDQIVPITTARVPIVKFFMREWFVK